MLLNNGTYISAFPLHEGSYKQASNNGVAYDRRVCTLQFIHYYKDDKFDCRFNRFFFSFQHLFHLGENLVIILLQIDCSSNLIYNLDTAYCSFRVITSPVVWLQFLKNSKYFMKCQNKYFKICWTQIATIFLIEVKQKNPNNYIAQPLCFFM